MQSVLKMTSDACTLSDFLNISGKYLIEKLLKNYNYTKPQLVQLVQYWYPSGKENITIQTA